MSVEMAVMDMRVNQYPITANIHGGTPDMVDTQPRDGDRLPDDEIGNGNPADPEGELPAQPDEEAEEVAVVDDDDGEQT